MRAIAIAGALVLGASPAGVASERAQAPPDVRVLTYLWNYDHWLLRQYVAGVTLSGGRTIISHGKPRLVGATANLYTTLRDDPKLVAAARNICLITATGIRTLHLRATISEVRVWSVVGRMVARC